MTRAHIAAALLTATLWGFNLIAGKVGVSTVPPLIFTTLRFTVVALLLVPFFPLARKHWRDLFILGTCFGTGHFGLLFVALAGMDAASAAIILQLGVPFSVLTSWLVFGERFGWKRSAGLLLAFVGVAFLAGEPRYSSVWAFVMMVSCTVFWAISNILVKRLSGVHPLAIAGWLSLFAAPQVFVLSLIFEDSQLAAIMTGGWPLAYAVAYTAIAASIVAHATWYSLLQRYPVNTVVPFNMLIPLIGAGAGLWILGEPLTLYKTVGGILTLAGVAVIQVRMMQQARTTGGH